MLILSIRRYYLSVRRFIRSFVRRFIHLFICQPASQSARGYKPLSNSASPLKED